jgi:hypothetical protein
MVFWNNPGSSRIDHRMLSTWILRTLRRAGWALAVVLFFWVVAATVFNAYALLPWLDMPTHFAGGLAMAYFVSCAIIQSQPILGPTPRAVRLFASLGLAALAAVGWEFFEFLSDRFLGSHLNLGVPDTLSDLLFGVLGALSFVVCSVIRGSRR